MNKRWILLHGTWWSFISHSTPGPGSGVSSSGFWEQDVTGYYNQDRCLMNDIQPVKQDDWSSSKSVLVSSCSDVSWHAVSPVMKTTSHHVVNNSSGMVLFNYPRCLVLSMQRSDRQPKIILDDPRFMGLHVIWSTAMTCLLVYTWKHLINTFICWEETLNNFSSTWVQIKKHVSSY